MHHRTQRTRNLFLFALSLLLVLVSPLVLAQTFRGGINGTVTDATGATVPGATVVAVNVGTDAHLSAVATSAGEFLFQDLPLGTYTITVTATGFGTQKIDNVNVSAGQIYTLPIKLSVSSSATTIEVDAAAIALDTTTVTQTTVLDAKAVANLPLNGRDFTQMLQLTPGYAGYSGNGFGSLNGTRANQLNWQIDGVDNNDLWHNVPAVNQGGVSGIAGIILPIDAVDQFSAQTQSGPEGGRNPGGTINLTLRSGTNSLHGSVYYFNRNELFGARNPFDTNPGPKQKIRNYNTGFSVGGPFVKDKLFGFLTFEHQRFVIGQSSKTTEPSVGWQAQAKAILANQGIPALPVMQTVLNTLWGTSILGQDTTGAVNNYHSTDPEYGYSWNGLAKIDWHITDKDSLTAHWFVGQGNQVAPVGSQLLSYYEVAPIHVQNIAIVYSRVLNSNLTNTVLAGVNYFNQVFDDFNTNFNVQGLGFITGASFTNAPNIVIRGFDKVGLTPPEGRNDITGHITDQVSWVKGKHQFRFGGEYRQAQLDEFYHRHATGSFTFDTSRITRKAGDPVYPDGGTPNQYDTYRYSLAAYLAGQTTANSITIGDPERQVFVNTWYLNAGDSWQVSSKLNVNYGVRYDYEGPLHDSKQNLSVFRPELTSTAGLAIQGAQISSLYERYFKSVSPRLGVSYQLAPTTVLRAAYGWYFDTPNLNPFLDNRPGNSAPNGVEGNPVGPSPVASISANGGKTQIVQGQNIFGGTTPSCNSVNVCGIFSIDRNFRPSYNQNYSFNVEQTLSPNVIAQIGYVGSEGRRLLALLDINQAAPQANPTGAQVQGTRPYTRNGAYPQYGNINQIESIGTSNYNSLQTQIRLQNFHRLSASAIYTWSHNLDEVTAYRGALPQDSFNFKGDYGNSDYDTRNTFIGFLSYDVPGSSHGPRFLSNGWIVNSLMSFHGGQPFSVAASGDISGTGEGNDRAVQVAPVRTGYLGRAPGVNWVDPNSFANAAPGSFGTSHRNAYYGPGFSDVDLSVFKDTRIHERLTIQLRAEMFNLFNRVNYGPPGFGSVNPAGGNLAVGGDFTLDTTIGGYNGAPGIGAGEPFNTQFGAKIIF